MWLIDLANEEADGALWRDSRTAARGVARTIDHQLPAPRGNPHAAAVVSGPDHPDRRRCDAAHAAHAAHATTPHLASGAGIAVEDSVVLAALLAEHPSVTVAFERFMELRFERCRDVVETSVAIGALQQSGASLAAFGALVGGGEDRLRADVWMSGRRSPRTD